MARYKCRICGYIYDEEKEGKPISELKFCPKCREDVSNFVKIEESEDAGRAPAAPETPAKEEISLAYDPETARVDPKVRAMWEIHEMAVTGKTLHACMSTRLPLPKWEEILLLGGQLNPAPLFDDEEVNLKTVIGKHAAKPMVLDGPVYVSHMSFGALSKEAKIALAKGASLAGTAMCSGEGGILPEEKAAAQKYIFEIIPNMYSVTEKNLKEADAIEIKIGQGTKPGMGGHLPGEKVTPEIAEIRGKKVGEDIQSPSKFKEIETKEDLKAFVAKLRTISEGRPIGIKLAAGHIEKDLKFALYAKPDFITIDGRGGATGSSPFLLREATSVPTIYALARARKYLDEQHSDVSLVITGGLRVSGDFAKAIAMGADAVAVATGALMALGCQQYRICGSGHCPVGIATQDPELRKRLHVDIAAQRVANYFKVAFSELASFARVTGHHDIHDLSEKDLITTSEEIHKYTGIRHAGED
nr:glutamate synthase-related protein [uncultured Dialister sp.]